MCKPFTIKSARSDAGVGLNKNSSLCPSPPSLQIEILTLMLPGFLYSGHKNLPEVLNRSFVPAKDCFLGYDCHLETLSRASTWQWLHTADIWRVVSMLLIALNSDLCR